MPVETRSDASPRAGRRLGEIRRARRNIPELPMPKSVAKSFRATLEPDGTNLKWIVIQVPLDVASVWGSRGMLKVKGEINGFAFRTSLFPNGKGGHTLLINKRMQAGAKAGAGTTANFRLQPDTEQRTVTVPAELKRILAEDRSFRRWFDQLTYSTQKYVADWVTDVKSEEARKRRAERVAEQLLSTMQAEQELPPALERVLPSGSLAREGWDLMSKTQRRRHLLGIFYYRTPESGGRRIEKMLAEAEQVAERKNKRKTE
jgi:Domain of unknown function (DUF1905)/Bacteriocin-protection, YdeI or OmpD-Associated